MRPDHRLARRRKVALRDLAPETFVAHNVRSPSRDYVIDTFRKAGVPLNIGIELSSLETIKQFVEMKVGVAILPRLSVEQELRDRKFVVKAVEGFRHVRTLRVIFLRGKVQSRAASKFLEVLMQRKTSTPSAIK
jgi:DNA-binding transcriptional LysR family regulator